MQILPLRLTCKFSNFRWLEANGFSGGNQHLINFVHGITQFVLYFSDISGNAPKMYKNSPRNFNVTWKEPIKVPILASIFFACKLRPRIASKVKIQATQSILFLCTLWLTLSVHASAMTSFVFIVHFHWAQL